MSETFEEWFKYQEDRAIEEMGGVPELHDNFVLKNMCEAAWQTQQSKLDKANERIAELEKKLAEAVKFMEVQKDIAFRRCDSFLYNDLKRLLKSLEEKEGEG